MVHPSYMVDHKKTTRTRRIVEDFVFCLFRGEKVMPVLYYIPPSTPCRAVLLLGRLLNIEFELRFLDILNGEQLKPEFLEVSGELQRRVNENDINHEKINVNVLVNNKLIDKSTTFGADTWRAWISALREVIKMMVDQSTLMSQLLHTFRLILFFFDFCPAEPFSPIWCRHTQKMIHYIHKMFVCVL